MDRTTRFVFVKVLQLSYYVGTFGRDWEGRGGVVCLSEVGGVSPWRVTHVDC